MSESTVRKIQGSGSRPPASLPEEVARPAAAEVEGEAVEPAGGLPEAGTVSDETTGADSAPSHAPPRVSLQDATVISDRPPAPVELPRGGVGPSELGRMLEGERLDHFELDKFIGGGGMGAVFRGTDTALGRPVAIKVLLTHFANDDETVRRFHNEAQSAARLDHENIARVYYVGEDRGWHYIVLEFIEGENLRDRVQRQGPLPLAEVVSYTQQIAEALAHASSRDVVHRDIKPSNVLVNNEGRAKLVDMGLARLHQVEHTHDDLTASGVTLGTFDYISPEQARDPRSADVRSDLYSLGCTFYFMLTGRPPFPDGTVLQKLLQHQGDDPPDPREFRGRLPRQICLIAQKLLAKNPEDRYQDPHELLADLALVTEQLQLPSPVTQTSVWMSTTPPPSGWSQRHLPWLVPLGLLVAIAALVHFSGPRATPPVATPPRLVAAPAQQPGAPRLVLPSTSPAEGTGEGAGEGAGEASPPPAGAGPAEAAPPSLTAAAAGDPPAAAADPPPHGDPPASGPAAGPAAERLADQPPGTAPDPSTPASSNGEPPPDSTVPAAAAAHGEQPLLIVRSDPQGEGEYASLAEACRHARSGDVIELRFDGRRAEPEQPVTITDRKLTIRAGEGFQPVIWFRPAGPDRVLYPRSMIHVAGGELLMSNVHLELDLPIQVRSDDWSLFETVVADRIRLTRCTMTIRNAGLDLSALYRDVSFFHIKTAPRRVRTTSDERQVTPVRLQLDLRDCVARGEAAFLRGTALETVQLQWENGLVAISETFVDLEGQTGLAQPSARLEIELKHLTCLCRRGFCRMVSREDQRHLAGVRVDCTDCILITTDAPLFQQSGVQTEEEFKRHLWWNGDHNFYENISSFWRMESNHSPEVVDMDWRAWQEYWGPGRERLDRPLPVLWQTAVDAELPLHAHPLPAYALDESTANPARAASTDGMSDAGAQPARLPPLPAQPPPAAPAVEEPRGP